MIEKPLTLLIPVASCAGILLGLLMITMPQQCAQLRNRLRAWYKNKPVIRWLDKPRYFEHLYYRHHQLLGVFISIGSLWTLWGVAELAGLQGQLVDPLVGSLPKSVIEILITTGIILMVLGASFSLVIGLIVFFRPSLLKGLEDWANLWLSSREDISYTYTESSDVSDRALFRLAGSVLLLLGISGIVEWTSSTLF